MQLQSMMITGFKSFQEAKFEFPKGITAVVGPNGAGKSNIVDAMLWVLGEQSTKALRSERMEDVIFNGTETRKPLGMAEVSLVLNDITAQELEAISGLVDELPGTKELMITRRLYRDGVSEYYINKISCRLKDIRSLFLEAGAGTKGHTVIEQGNIEQILSASPQERRGFIEETAGIGRYKKQKTEALRKLRSTEQNLLRVRDIIAEVKRQLRSLERQAKQAEVYQRLRDESRGLEVKVLKSDYLHLENQRNAVVTSLGECEREEAEQVAQESQLMVRHEELKTDVLQKGEEASRLHSSLREIEQEMGKALTNIEVQRNRLRLYGEQQVQAQEETTHLAQETEAVRTVIQDLKERVHRAEEEIAQRAELLADLEEEEQDLSHKRSSTHTQVEHARSRCFEIVVEKTHADNRLKSIDERREQLIKRVDRLSTELGEMEEHRGALGGQAEQRRQQFSELRHQLDGTVAQREEQHHMWSQLETHVHELDAHLVTQQTELAAAESRLSALRAFFEEEFGRGPQQAPDAPSIREACQGIREAMVEHIDVPQEYEISIEAVLGEKIRSWVIHNVNEASPAIAYFKANNLGRGIFVPFQSVGQTGGSEEHVSAWWASLQQQAGVVGRALDLVRVPEELRSAWSCLLGQVVVVQNLDAALTLVNHPGHVVPDMVQLVTVDGEVVFASGVVMGGSLGDSAGLLQRKREIRNLDSKITSLSDILTRDRVTCQTQKDECGFLKEKVQILDQAIKESEMQVALEEQELNRLTVQLEELDQKIQTITTERQVSQEEQSQLDPEEEATTVLHRRLEEEESEQTQTLERSLSMLGEIEEQGTHLQDRLTEARLTLNSYRERLDHDQTDLVRFQEEDEARQERLRLLHQRVEELAQQSQSSEQEQIRSEVQFQQLDQNKSSVQADLVTVEEQHAESMTQARQMDQTLHGIRKQHSDTRERRMGIEVRLAELRTRLETLEETLGQTYDLSLEDLLAVDLQGEESDGAMDQEDQLSQWRERLQDIRTRLDRMGPINLAAIDEHRELDERYTFLTKQEQDLSESIRSLQEIIERLNNTTNQKFEETFQALQEKFSEVFSALFAGGKAELILVKPEGEPEPGEFQEEPGVDIAAQPPGKRLKTLGMLSGGEKTLTVMALMFASFLIRPSPFCILDEVDAPLDEVNVVRFARFLTKISEHSQFVVITHNKQTMEVADSLFGVTMEEPGVSKFVAVRLADLETVG